MKSSQYGPHILGCTHTTKVNTKSIIKQLKINLKKLPKFELYIVIYMYEVGIISNPKSERFGE